MAARSLNKVQIIGNLTRDPELKYTGKGTPLCTFGVATNRVYTPSDATESVEETEFHNVVAWGKLAELCSQLLHKGWKAFIEGRLNTRSWQDAESGKTMYRTEIVANEMIVLGAPRGARTEEVGMTGGESEPAVEAAADQINVEPDEAVESQTKKGVTSEKVSDKEEKEMPF
ncbi:MAG: single-stranded DNA-binding protein [Candidatus Cloacimonetes bacterium]|nr:single-stranded DNA-binding protein [Candidatus Cloacimonadota bacterium]